jgi:methionyl-tRNA formyltransferase
VDLVLFGTADIARPVLRALVEGGHAIRAIITQPDRPRGRSGAPVPPPVKEEARALALAAPVLQPEKLRTRQAREAIERLGPFDAGVVVAYGQLIPRRILELPRRGCLNVHASLLPRWRGAAPVQRAIAAGDRETGVTVMRVTERLDAGPVLAARATPIGAEETAAEVLARLGDLGAALLAETLARWACGEAVPEIAQEEGLATHAAPIAKEEGLIDWTRPAAEIAARRRAFAPWPGAFAFLHRRKGGEPLRVEILAARPAPDAGGLAREAAPPGAIVGRDAGGTLLVGAGEGLLAIARVKPAGKREMSADEWLRGRGAEPGDRFGGPPDQAVPGGADAAASP